MGEALLAGMLVALWALSLRLKDSSIIDLFWGPAFSVLYWPLAIAHGLAPRSMLVGALVSLWGMRLGLYLARRNLGRGEDKRYTAMRQKHGKAWGWRSLFIVFGLQGALVWIVALPIRQVALGTAPGWQWTDALGTALVLAGLAFESTGDWQLARFKADPANAGKIMNRGLWKATRHPNYFGDFVVWWGFGVFGLATGAWWSLAGPLVMSVLLIKVSGKDLLEKNMAARPGFAEYARTTSGFVPWWPLLLVLMVGCGAPNVEAVSPTVARTQVAQRFHGASRATTTVYFPANGDGPHPAVVFVPGGFVDPQRHAWFATALAERGYVVAIAEPSFGLALLDVDRVGSARAALVSADVSPIRGLADPARIAVAGHSLGGVVAAKLALTGGYAALLLQASEPDVPDGPLLTARTMPSLSLAGRNDCSATLASVTAGAKALPHPSALVVLDGVTHYQFTNDDAEDRGRGCASGVSLETAHERIVAASVAFLDAALGDAPTAGLPALAQIPGAEVTVP